MAQSSSLPEVPKFGPTGPGPQSLGDWVDFWRWLTSLWRVARDAINAQQAVTITQSQQAVPHGIDLAAFLALGGASQRVSRETRPAPLAAPPVPQQAPSFDPAQALALGQLPSGSRADELTGLAAFLLTRPPYPTPQKPPFLIEDTHANRVNYPASTYSDSLYWETDRTVFYISLAGNWLFASGVYRDVLANIPAGFGANDAGFQFEATDYKHQYEWDGAAWGYAPGDPGSGFIGWYTEAPNAGLWHLADGTAGVVRSLATGVTGTFTVPDLRGSYPKGAAGYTGTVIGATSPTFGGTLAIANAATGLTVNNTATTPVLVTVSGLVPVAAQAHAHGVTDPQHTHALTGSGAVGSNGEPQHVELIPYYRL